MTWDIKYQKANFVTRGFSHHHVQFDEMLLTEQRCSLAHWSEVNVMQITRLHRCSLNIWNGLASEALMKPAIKFNNLKLFIEHYKFLFSTILQCFLMSNCTQIHVHFLNHNRVYRIWSLFYILRKLTQHVVYVHWPQQVDVLCHNHKRVHGTVSRSHWALCINI